MDMSVDECGDHAHDSGENHGNGNHPDMTEAEITDAYLQSSLRLEESRSGGHRAGFDAFMTGFVLACFISKHCTMGQDGGRVVGAGIKFSQLTGLEGLTNKIYATGKDQPIIVAKSNFCNPSKNHMDRMQKLRKM
jgi:target of EGR1 protein 1